MVDVRRARSSLYPIGRDLPSCASQGARTTEGASSAPWSGFSCWGGGESIERGVPSRLLAGRRQRQPLTPLRMKFKVGKESVYAPSRSSRTPKGAERPCPDLHTKRGEGPEPALKRHALECGTKGGLRTFAANQHSRADHQEAEFQEKHSSGSQRDMRCWVKDLGLCYRQQQETPCLGSSRITGNKLFSAL